MSAHSTHPEWIKRLHLDDRAAPDIFTSADQVVGQPYGPEMRSGFEELGLSGYFCISGSPTAAFVEADPTDTIRLWQLHQALWNQGLAPVLLVISGSEARAFSLSHRPQPNFLAAQQIGDVLSCAADHLAATHFIEGLESGRIFREYARGHFSTAERIDQVLLANLKVALQKLIDHELSVGVAQALLMQTMFVAYLEERQAILPQYFQNACNNRQVTGLEKLLETLDAELVSRLFRQLKHDFNGHIFVGPGRFREIDPAVSLGREHLEVLHDFRAGKFNMETGQHAFWPYQFRYIPVELISAVYDRFLKFNPEQQRTQGEFYTPAFLADFTVGQLLELHPVHQNPNAPTKVLDPACGSGIFLVRLFQRRIEEWRRLHPGLKPNWNVLTTQLDHLHGSDRNPDAIRVAAFSLYVALLEQVRPEDIQTLASRQEHLPNLLGETLKDIDFFDLPEEETFDLLIGNPPWVSRDSESNTVKRAKEWCKAHSYEVPANQAAWGFVWKGLRHIKESGHFALLLPGMAFLVNEEARAARLRMLGICRMERIVNLADLRRLLFDKARNPTVLMVGSNKPSTKPDELIDYWCPKGDPALPARQVLTITNLDRSRLTAIHIATDPRRFKLDFWMRSPDKRLFQWLDALPKLELRARQYSEIARQHRFSLLNCWIVGEGFQPPSKTGKRKSTPSTVVGKLPHLGNQGLTRWSVVPPSIPFPINEVRTPGFIQGFTGPRVLVAEGWRQTSDNRGGQKTAPLPAAAYYEEPATFDDTIFAIRGNTGDEEDLKLLSAFLNSRLYAWYLFHTSAYPGMEREKLKSSEILGIPFPLPEQMNDVDRANAAKRNIVGFVDEWSKPPEVLSSSISEKDEQNINQLVYDYFGLSFEERALIDDTVEFILPALQPSRDARPALHQAASTHDYAAYANTLTRRLNVWLTPGKSVETALVGDDEDTAVIRLSLVDGEVQPFTRLDNTSEMRSAIRRLREELCAMNSQAGTNLELVPDAVLIDGNSLYLIKPRAKRHWLRATALADVDNLVAELNLRRTVEKTRSTRKG